MTMKIEIEKDIPLGTKINRESKYPFRKMEIGDSFGIPLNAQGSVKRIAWAQSRKLGMSFVVRRQPDGLYRCWRIAPVVKTETAA